LVEVVQAKRSCEGIDKDNIISIGRDDICEVEFIEVCASNYSLVAGIANYCLLTLAGKESKIWGGLPVAETKQR
jgi:hypothetical protein